MRDLVIASQLLPSKKLMIVRLSGSINSCNFQRLEEAIENIFAQGFYRLLFDMGEVHEIALPGLGVFLNALLAAQRNGGSIVFANASPTLRGMLEMFELTSEFTLAENRQVALAAF
ncbi:MAG TPA: STAS domain-containing protein [Planctomycetota bacterium]|jgi:anti-anti-sigma factor